MLIDAKQIKNLAQKLPVRAVTTTALVAGGTPVYANGTLGFGATLTAAANSALDVVDGVTLVVGDRVLNNHDAIAGQRGIYVVTNAGSGATKWVLTRASDADTNIKTFPGCTVTSTGDGSANKNREWILSTTGAITIGTTAQTWILEVESTSVVPTSSNKQMTASVTTTDGTLACATALVSTPTNGGYVQVFINGVKQVLGDGVKTKDCYFSADGGTTAKTIASISNGDLLYWNGSVASWQLSATDVVDFDYNV